MAMDWKGVLSFPKFRLGFGNLYFVMEYKLEWSDRERRLLHAPLGLRH